MRPQPTQARHLPRKLPDYLIAVVLMLVPFHAFLTVWLSDLVGHYTLLRLWPECALLVLSIWAIVRLSRDRTLRREVIGTKLAKLILAFIGLTLLLGLVAHLRGEVSAKALWYGVLLNARFFAWMGVTWVFACGSTWLHEHWQKFVLIPLAVVSVFALIQFFFLPSNFLTHFGYDTQTTIAPIQTINQDTTTIRAQSFLRGANPLGAYLVVMTGLLLAVNLRRWQRTTLFAASLLALLLSFSRSAIIGFAGMLATSAFLLLDRRRLKQVILGGMAVFGLFVVLLIAFRHNSGVQNAVFHVNNRSTASVTSDSGHNSAVRQGVSDVIHEPLGRGPGTAGPASVYNHDASPRNSENYFLNVGQELGWLGLILFIALLGLLAKQLCVLNTPFGYALLATLVGLSVVNLFSYAWTDPTLAYLWWGLAGIALGAQPRVKGSVKKKASV